MASGRHSVRGRLVNPDCGPALYLESKELSAYKYHITPNNGMQPSERSDPFGFYAEVRPKTASLVWDLDKYKWQDDAWMKKRKYNNGLEAPISVYEATWHPGCVCLRMKIAGLHIANWPTSSRRTSKTWLHSR